MKILLIEDSRTLAAIMTARLQSYGHDVQSAENGQAGLQAFIHGAFDLVLMDIEMPVMNGLEATRRIRDHEAQQVGAWTPVLFLTASDTEEKLLQAIDAGGDDFLSKATPEPILHAKMRAMARIAALRQHLAEANVRLAQQASRDGLTGLFNRRHMDQLTDQTWKICSETSQPFALLMLDIDNFKKYNDHYGHQQGDDCLRAVALSLAQSVSDAGLEDAFVARYGGEEFSVILPGVSDEAYRGLPDVLLGGVRALGIPHQLNGDQGIVTVSIGGARAEPAAGRIVELFRRADALLYRAKERGRNQAVLWDDGT